MRKTAHGCRSDARSAIVGPLPRKTTPALTAPVTHNLVLALTARGRKTFARARLTAQELLAARRIHAIDIHRRLVSARNA